MDNPETAWLPFDRGHPPSESGIYAIRSGGRWLYIGKSRNIARRIRYHHPVPLTAGLAMPIELMWMPVARDLGKVEARAIREHQPEWNGSTWDTPFAGYADGIYCEWQDPRSESLKGIWG